ncbi:Uncharacterised protein [Pandoraea pulmonicola]|uniref:Uncharacterized protein n=1 Tax=Pandoraea pulmonicola TaxID=93221 RepID=A0AAJ4Z9G6_PANPU|nr:Uncharacterised protein [Pandoraea pulmonicola]
MARGLFIEGAVARQAAFLVVESVTTVPMAWDGDVTGEGDPAPL